MGAANMFSNSPDAPVDARCYIKEVDANENTIRFVQEIYDAPVYSSPCTRSFPSIRGHKQL